MGLLRLIHHASLGGEREHLDPPMVRLKESAVCQARCRMRHQDPHAYSVYRRRLVALRDWP
jgi:hypothetical protein